MCAREISSLFLLSAVLLAGCAKDDGRNTPEPSAASEPFATSALAPPSGAETGPSAQPLADTDWELVEIQMMDDTQFVPVEPARYTLSFAADGDAYMQLDCNRGRSRWTRDGPGELSFGPVASTNALCQDDGLGERYAAQFEYVRSYLMRDGHLFLATLADGAIIEFQPGSSE